MYYIYIIYYTHMCEYIYVYMCAYIHIYNTCMYNMCNISLPLLRIQSSFLLVSST